MLPGIISTTGQNKQFVVYDYFNLTDELMNQDHKADSSLPICRSKKANYYVQRRLFLSDAAPAYGIYRQVDCEK